MANITCARCGASDDEASASFAEEGIICAQCARGEQAKDVRQLKMAEQEAMRGQSARPIEVRTAGPVRTTATHRELEAQGLVVEKTDFANSVDSPLGSIRTEGYRERWTLPSPPAVQASFSPEGIGKKLIKLFKSELQTGDKAFDDAVYVSTDTRDATAAFLSDAEVRALIGAIVSRGGHVSIEGSAVDGQVSWSTDDLSPPDHDLIARVARALLSR